MNWILYIENIKRAKFLFYSLVGCLLIGSFFACKKDDDSDSYSPVDIIIVVDNSGDMKAEIQGLTENVYISLAKELEDKKIDYKIILIGKYGMIDNAEVCIESPLSGIANCSTPPFQPVNTVQFFHYSVEVSSTNSLCKILETLQQPDEYSLALNGWISLLRSNSSKSFIELSSDGVDCFSGIGYNDLNTIAGGTIVAQAFNAALINLSPDHFGTSSNPNYSFYSIIGIPDKDANDPGIPYSDTDAMISEECVGAVNPGTGYQGISRLTGGLRFSACEAANYELIFNELAQSIIDKASD